MNKIFLSVLQGHVYCSHAVTLFCLFLSILAFCIICFITSGSRLITLGLFFQNIKAYRYLGLRFLRYILTFTYSIK